MELKEFVLETLQPIIDGMKNNKIDKLEQQWDAISRTPGKFAGTKEAQKKAILTQLGVSVLSPEGGNLSEPMLDERFRDYVQTQRAKINDKRNFWLGVLGVIIAAGILVAMILIAVFKD